MNIRYINLNEIDKLWAFEKENRIEDLKREGGSLKELLLWEITNNFKKPWADKIKSDFIDKKIFILIIEDNKKIIGYSIFRINSYILYHVPNIGFIDELFISKNKRKKGFGKKLLEKTLFELKTAGVRKIIISVFVSNVPANKLYSEYKFTDFKIDKVLNL